MEQEGLTDMSMLLLVLVPLVVLVLLVLVVQAASRPGDDVALSQRERSELESLRVLTDDLKETAWQHRELDSPLATIIIDMIRSHERRDRG